MRPILPQNLGSKTAAWLSKCWAHDCLLCSRVSEDELLCAACAADLPRLPLARCPLCALPTPFGEICAHCLRTPPHYERTLAAFRYDFPLDRLIQSFKYGHRLALAPYFGKKLAALAKPLDVDLIVPLPLHAQRLRERGFNQALELARPVRDALGLPLNSTICQRLRATPAQAALPWDERVKNVRGAFHCAGDLTDQRILLIDDVMTTGASLNECARTLKQHGAREVILLVVARVLAKD